MSKYRDWLLSDYFDEKTKAELKNIEDDEKEIEDRFYTDLSFGTGGMRGKIGAGTNRINKYTVRKVTQGLANYIVNYCDTEGRERGVVIAYDSRYKSEEFAREAALVLAGNGIKTYLFDDLRPTPELSYAVRKLEAIAGVVITASHNPPDYNGYKVYGDHGGQVVPEEARKIIAEIDEINDFSLIKWLEEEKARSEGLLEIIGEEVDKDYIEEMQAVIPNTDLTKKAGTDFPIIFTPLHGTGNMPARRLLQELGFSAVKVVEEQADPDPEFTTVDTPNPEEFSSFELALELAEREEPELIIATDPDGDRMGLVYRSPEGEYIPLNGNQVGVFMTDYLLNNREVPENGVIIKTIVSTEMVRKIAADYGVEVMDVLTGFKFIGEKMEEFAATRNKKFIFGFEESYGYLTGNYARDKDAIVAVGLAASMALFYNREGMTLGEKLEELREKYGYYLEDLESIIMEGKEGQETIAATISHLRKKAEREIAGSEVVIFKDYRERIARDYRSDQEKEIELPQSNVLQYLLADDSIITIRPSGTEPKLKIYFAVRGENQVQARKRLEELKRLFLARVHQIIEEV